MSSEISHPTDTNSEKYAGACFDGFNAEQFRRSIGDVELMQKLGVLFREDMPVLLAAAFDALSKGNAEELGDSAHALKGMLGSYAASGAYELAKQLECDAKRGELVEAKEQLELLAVEVDRLTVSLDVFLEAL